jgi:hypothetical protein
MVELVIVLVVVAVVQVLHHQVVLEAMQDKVLVLLELLEAEAVVVELLKIK